METASWDVLYPQLFTTRISWRSLLSSPRWSYFQRAHPASPGLLEIPAPQSFSKEPLCLYHSTVPSSWAGRGGEKLVSNPCLHAMSGIRHSHHTPFLPSTPFFLLKVSAYLAILSRNCSLSSCHPAPYPFQVCCTRFLRGSGQTCGWDCHWETGLVLFFSPLLFSVRLPIMPEVWFDFLTAVWCWKWPFY